MEGVDAIEEESSQEKIHVEEKEQEQEHEVDQPGIHNGLKCKKLSWKNLIRLDSFDLEADRFTSNQGPGSSQVLFFVFSFLLFIYLVILMISIAYSTNYRTNVILDKQ